MRTLQYVSFAEPSLEATTVKLNLYLDSVQDRRPSVISTHYQAAPNAVETAHTTGPILHNVLLAVELAATKEVDVKLSAI